MPLFIDRLPLHRWIDRTRTPTADHWSIRLPALLSPSASSPLTGTQPQPWTVDTGFSGEAFAWRHHLEAAGLDPATERVSTVTLRGSAIVGGVQAVIRLADVWLVSNLSNLAPIPLRLNGGVAFRDRHLAVPDPEFHRPLLGMRPLIRAGLKLELDLAGRTVSVWTP